MTIAALLRTTPITLIVQFRGDGSRSKCYEYVPYYGSLAEWGIYDEALPYKLVLHNIEDAGVVVYYQCEDGCPELVDQLTEIVDPAVAAGQRVVMMPNDMTAEFSGRTIHEDMTARIALTSWGRIDKFDNFNAERVRSFINRYQGIDHH